MKNRILIFLILILFQNLSAQIVTIDPPFATVDDDITVYYDATQGSGELEGISPIFMHTGVLIDGQNGWQYVQGNWGTFDGNVIMNNEGNNIHSRSFNIRDFYGVPQGETVTHLAFVFRNQDGSLEGKTADYQDIFVPIYLDNAQFLISISSPAEETIIEESGNTIPIKVDASKNATISLYEDGNLITSDTDTTLLEYNLTAGSTGEHIVIATANDGTTTVSDTFRYIVNPSITVAEPPAGTLLGLNRIDNNTVRLKLYAPFKDYVYVIGDFNNWQPNLDYYMKRSSDGATWWLDITGLDSNTEYAYQYFVSGDLKIADPYSEKILDKWNDPYIPESVYPNLKPYPENQTTGIVSTFKTINPIFNWQHDNYSKPAIEDLVIYELLVRDFSEQQSFQMIIDSLDYLQRLGINAIELMPVNEFEGNNSWGYNPSFHMALDKYYGTAETFKTLVDEAHARGMAVFIDVVYNHAFSQSPLAQLYWDNANFRPSPQNPWLNATPMHPFNVGSDFNHEAQATKDWLDRVMVYWIEEYHLDGFRFDLSKGFTQNFSSDVGIWGQYDASRIALLKRTADVCWGADPDFRIILEHFADANEERELSDYGMLIWGNINHEYSEAAMAYSSNLTGVDYQVSWRSFNDPHLVGYMESHDEERLMYKNLQFGNAGSGYDIKSLPIALDREELVGAFFFTIPGPKMIWQFGELGYDYSINRCEDGTVNPDCRLSPKPVRWDYYQMQDRRDLYDIWSSLIHIKTNYEVFKTTDYNYDLTSKIKKIHLNHNSMNVTVVGNFDVQSNNTSPQFQHTGTWYEYFTGQTLEVNDVNMSIDLEAGEYRLYTDQFVENPNLNINNIQEISGLLDLNINPNPSNGELFINLELENTQNISIDIIDINGKNVSSLYHANTNQINIQTDLDNHLANGIYTIRIMTDTGVSNHKWILQR